MCFRLRLGYLWFKNEFHYNHTSENSKQKTAKQQTKADKTANIRQQNNKRKLAKQQTNKLNNKQKPTKRQTKADKPSQTTPGRKNEIRPSCLYVLAGCSRDAKVLGRRRRRPRVPGLVARRRGVVARAAAGALVNGAGGALVRARRAGGAVRGGRRLVAGGEPRGEAPRPLELLDEQGVHVVCPRVLVRGGCGRFAGCRAGGGLLDFFCSELANSF